MAIGERMSTERRLQTSRLREIGWRHWDPIGLADDEGSPPEGRENEYDQYLLHVVSMIDRGASTAEAAEYLKKTASESMGLTATDANAAAATADAIADYLLSLPEGQRTVR